MALTEEDLAFKNKRTTGRRLNKWLFSKLCHAIHITTSLAKCWSHIRAYTSSLMCLTSWRMQTGNDIPESNRNNMQQAHFLQIQLCTDYDKTFPCVEAG
jgi:hypothetical protein